MEPISIDFSERSYELFKALEDPDVKTIVCSGPTQSSKTFSTAWGTSRTSSRRTSGANYLLVTQSRGAYEGALRQYFSDWASYHDISIGVAGKAFTLPSWIEGNPPPNKFYSAVAKEKGALDRIMGPRYKFVVADEGTRLVDGVIDRAASRLSAVGSKLIIVTNPDTPAHPIYTKYIEPVMEKADAGKRIRYFQFQLSDNPTLDPHYEEDLIIALGGPDTAATRQLVFGEWVFNPGLVYPGCEVAIEGSKECRRRAPNPDDITNWGIAMDYGNPGVTHALLIGRTRDKGDWVMDEYRWDGRAEYQKTMPRMVSEMLAKFNVPALWPSNIIVDKNCIDVMHEISAQIIRACGRSPNVIPIDDEKDKGIQLAGAFMRTGRFTLSRNAPEAVKELRNYEIDPKTDKPFDKDDHAMDAMYGWIYTMAGLENKRTLIVPRPQIREYSDEALLQREALASFT